jgi:hypothetical protein
MYRYKPHTDGIRSRPGTRLWNVGDVKPLDERFGKIGTYEVYRVKCNLLNGLPPRYRDKRAVRPESKTPRSQEKKSRLERRLRWWTSFVYGVLVAFRNASLTSPAASCAEPLALSNLPSS